MTSRSWGRGGQGFCDDSTKVLVIKSVTCCPNLRDIIYGRPLGVMEEIIKTFQFSEINNNRTNVRASSIRITYLLPYKPNEE